MKNNNEVFGKITESIRLLLQLDYDTTIHELEQKYKLAVMLNKLPHCKECHRLHNGCLASKIDQGHHVRYNVPGPHYGRCLFRMLPKKIR